MGLDWRETPALLAGVGLLAATIYLVGLPDRAQREAPPPNSVVQAGAAQAGLPAGSLLARPGIPEGERVATRPSEALAWSVERVARGALPDPYFLDNTAASRFLERWQGRLIDGRVRVAMADDFDAGAENGHRVPVTLWIDSDTQVMGLTGEAAFEPAPAGQKLRDVKLEPVKLAVSTWAEAARRVKLAHPSGGEPTRTNAPFYGHFRFTQGGRHFAVHAVTGQVIGE